MPTSLPRKNFISCIRYLLPRTFTYLFALCMCMVATVQGQTITNSPYSRFGIGELQFTNFAPQLAMGGIGNGFASKTVTNINNPATYSSLSLSTFQIGLSSVLTQQSSAVQKQTLLNNNFQYLTLAFPISERCWGASIGMIPYSGMGYNISDTLLVDNQQVVNVFQGSGGINEFYVGNAIKPFAIFSDSLLNDFSIGVNASYLYGDITKQRRQIYESSSNYLNLRESNITNYGGWKFRLGALYKFKFKKEFSLSVGGFYQLQSELNSTRTVLAESYLQEVRYEVVRDTVNYVKDVTSKTSIPLSKGVGVVLRKGERFLIGFDISSQQWSKFTSYGNNDSLQNSRKASVGMQYTPNANSSAGFFQHTQYRVGAYYSQLNLKPRQVQLNEMAVTFGFGFPLKKSFSTINVACEIGKRGTTSNGLIMEKFAKINFGFVINDRWFIKRKIE